MILPDKFPGFPSPLPYWLPDETFYSLCCRYHLLSGNRLAATTCNSLFGHPRQGSQHDFPNRLEHFCLRSDGICGSAEEIAKNRTIISFYFPLKSPEVVSHSILATQGNASGNLKFRLGILTSRFRANHPLKACASCMVQDIATHGIAYWHLEHQLPGVWVCTSHLEPLLVSEIKSTGVGRFHWTLPSPNTLLSSSELLGTSRGQTHGAAQDRLRFARIAQSWARYGRERHLDKHQLSLIYRNALHERGFSSESGNIRSRQAYVDYASSVSRLALIPEMASLIDHGSNAASNFVRWIASPRTGTHPIRHLALIFWLFNDWDSFINRFQEDHRAGPLDVLSGSEGIKPDPRRNQFQSLIAQGHSCTHAAKEIGVSVQTAMSWATQLGHQTARRPKTLKAQTLVKLVAALRAGRDRTDIAKELSISVSSVTRILRSEIGLQGEWDAARNDRARSHHRTIWTNALERSPHVGKTLLRTLVPATFGWLYRNDRAWLDSSCKERAKPRQGNARRVDWHARDVELSAAITELGLALRPQGVGGKISLWQLYQALPELKAKLSALARLPLTRSAVSRLTGQWQHGHTGELF